MVRRQNQGRNEGCVGIVNGTVIKRKNKSSSQAGDGPGAYLKAVGPEELYFLYVNVLSNRLQQRSLAGCHDVFDIFEHGRGPGARDEQESHGQSTQELDAYHVG